MAALSDFLNAIISTYSAFKISGQVRDNADPVVDFIGIKGLWRQYIIKPYRDFEDNFTTKHPMVHRTYQAFKKGLNNILTFAVSETGCRILSMATLISTAIASGGIIPAIGVGIYAAGVGVALIQETINKVGLNKITEEANLLKRFAKTYAEKMKLAQQKNINLAMDHSQDKSTSKISSEIKKEDGIWGWMKASAKYLSTYALEVAIPVALSALSPIHGIILSAKLGIFIGASACGVGAGVYFKKLHEQQKQELSSYIKQANGYDFIPGYNNISQLRDHIIKQDIEFKALQQIPDGLKPAEAEKQLTQYKKEISPEALPILQDTSTAKQYLQAFTEVINPYDSSNQIQDPKEFIKTVASVASTVIVANAALSLGFKGLNAAGAIMTTGVTAGAGAVLASGAASLIPPQNKSINSMHILDGCKEQLDLALGKTKELATKVMPLSAEIAAQAMKVVEHKQLTTTKNHHHTLHNIVKTDSPTRSA